MKKINRTTTTSAACLALAALAATSLAQVREIPQGRVLDANPQVGSGGSNNPVPGYVPINGNNIIWGQVGGLSYFHSTAGSSSPYVFQNNLPSASLDTFTRQSAPLGPSGAPRIYYDPATVVSTAQGRIFSAPTNSGFDSRITPGVPAAAPPAQIRPNEDFSTLPYRAGPMTLEVPEDSGQPLTNPLWFNQQGTPSATPAEKPADNTNNTNNPNNPNGPIHTNEGSPATQPRNTAPHPETPALTTQPSGRAQEIPERTIVSDTYKTLLADLRKSQADQEAKDKAAGLTPQLPKIASTMPAPKNPIDLDRPGVVARNLENEPLSRLRSGKDLKPLNTLAATTGGMPATPFDTQMKQAETLLKDGKYLDAVDAYQAAIASQPENALAIVGRAHAELAAGMYQSSSFDLKFLFTRKPELIGVHYALADFIPQQRLDALLADLTKMTTAEHTGNTASFLYCYICYNDNHAQELQQELDRWGFRKNHDDWQPVAAKAWGK